MQLELVVDGTPYSVDVDPVAKTVRYRGQCYPYRVVSGEGEPVELEIAGEKIVVDGWPPHNDGPIGRLTVNGEVVRLDKLTRSSLGAAPAAVGAAAPEAAATIPASTPSRTPDGPGIAVKPPMPGKILEVKVSEGDRVTAGQLLLVLEAMKMRNEVVSPAAGVVWALTVVPGASVRSNEVLLRITES